MRRLLNIYPASGLSCSSSKSRSWWPRVQAEYWNHISAIKTATPTTPPVTNPATAEWPAAMVASRPAAEPVRTAVTMPIIPAVVRKTGQYPLRGHGRQLLSTLCRQDRRPLAGPECVQALGLPEPPVGPWINPEREVRDGISGSVLCRLPRPAARPAEYGFSHLHGDSDRDRARRRVRRDLGMVVSERHHSGG